jgi:L-lysine 6-transaminase
MVRARRYLEIMEADGLIAGAAARGAHLLTTLTELAQAHPGVVTNPRGRGLMCALDLPARAPRDEIVMRLREEEGVLVLPCGERSLRFRPALTVTDGELDAACTALAAVLHRTPSLSGASA